jgi:hypothetical protein
MFDEHDISAEDAVKSIRVVIGWFSNLLSLDIRFYLRLKALSAEGQYFDVPFVIGSMR